MLPASTKLRTPAARGRETLSVSIRIISPVHGGAVQWSTDEQTSHVRPLDPVTPLRLSAVRGQLRFWWRATHGCVRPSVAVMHADEGALWGASSIPGEVSLRLEEVRLTAIPLPVFEAKMSNAGRWNSSTKNGMREIAYGAFALQPRRNLPQQPPDGVLTDVSGTARLVLGGPKERWHEVLDALDAWLLFGGVGGRTRRGFGAVASSDREVDQALFLQAFGRSPTLPLVPSLHGAKVSVGASKDTGRDALSWALGKMQSFRQGAHVGRNPPSNEPGNRKPAGRSRWPEPEQIRELTRRSSERHRARFVNVDKFPRARFGLPIIFHFQDQGEPRDSTLKPKHFERMCSPLILRPILAGGKYRAFAVLLSVPEASEKPLVLREDIVHDVEASLTPTEARGVRPLIEHNASDVLTAFLSYFSQ